MWVLLRLAGSPVIQTVTTIGLDIAKSVFQVHGVDAAGLWLNLSGFSMQRKILLIWARLSPEFGRKTMRTSLLIALSGLLVIGAEAQAQVARQEIYALQSVTLSDSDFLSGKRDGVPVTLAGALRLPKLGTEKLPAVILLHGSGGVGGSGGMIDEWSRELNEIGVATFAVDSFAGRGIVETVTDQTRLGRLNMIIDAYRALDLLSKHRQIDATRIAVNGVLTRRSIFRLFEPYTLPKNA